MVEDQNVSMKDIAKGLGISNGKEGGYIIGTVNKMTKEERSIEVEKSSLSYFYDFVDNICNTLCNENMQEACKKLKRIGDIRICILEKIAYMKGK